MAQWFFEVSGTQDRRITVSKNRRKKVFRYDQGFHSRSLTLSWVRGDTNIQRHVIISKHTQADRLRADLRKPLTLAHVFDYLNYYKGDFAMIRPTTIPYILSSFYLVCYTWNSVLITIRSKSTCEQCDNFNLFCLL